MLCHRISLVALFAILAGSMMMDVHGSQHQSKETALSAGTGNATPIAQEPTMGQKLAYLAERTCLKQAKSDFIDVIGGSVDERFTDLVDKHVLSYNVMLQDGVDGVDFQNLALLEAGFKRTRGGHVRSAKYYPSKRSASYMSYQCKSPNDAIKAVTVILGGLPSKYVPMIPSGVVAQPNGSTGFM